MCFIEEDIHVATYEEMFSTWIMREMQITTTRRAHISLTQLAELRKCNRFKCCRVCGSIDCLTCAK